MDADADVLPNVINIRQTTQSRRVNLPNTRGVLLVRPDVPTVRFIGGNERLAVFCFSIELQIFTGSNIFEFPLAVVLLDEFPLQSGNLVNIERKYEG